MKYKFLPALATALAAVAVSHGAYAMEVGTIDELKTCLDWNNDEGVCTLTDNVTITESIQVSKEVELDLNGNKLALTGNSELLVYYGNMNITGEGEINSEESNYAPFYVWGSTNSSATNFSTLTIGKDVMVKTGDEGWGIVVPNNSGHAYGVVVNIDGTIDAGYGMTINGIVQDVADNAPTFNIGDTATILSKGHAIYAAGYGHWNIGAASIAGKEGVGLKAGTFAFNDTNINVDGEYNKPDGWGNGIHDSGATIQIESHDGYADNVEITINGGTYVSQNGHVIYEYKAAEDTQNAVRNIEINGGTFTAGEEKDVFQVSENFTVEKFIEGGEFSTLPPVAYIKEGKEIYDVSPDGPYFVEDDVEAEYPETIYLEVGESYDFGGDGIVSKYATLGIDNREVLEGEELAVTATGTGEAIVNINYHDYITPTDTNVTVKAYELDVKVEKLDENSELVETEDEELEDYALEQIKKYLDGEETEEKIYFYESAEEIKEYLVNGGQLEVVIDTEPYDLDDEEVRTYLEETFDGHFEDGDGVAGAYYAGIEFIIRTGNDGLVWVGSVAEMSDEVQVEFEIDDKYLEVPEGYERKFYVIRHHYNADTDEDEFTRIPAELNGNKLTFGSDKFSAFVIVYQDVEEETGEVAPNTGRFTASSNEGGAVSMNTGSFIAKKVVAMILAFVGFRMLAISLARAKRERNL
ncbi:hypothetical protein IJG21_00480 [Candidatus Saccharibacteria bacterium]|nr:hypothetical protein [Candidatus Saccharibacteria bacterium]